VLLHCCPLVDLPFGSPCNRLGARLPAVGMSGGMSKQGSWCLTGILSVETASAAVRWAQ
jgi:hypothetical protein